MARRGRPPRTGSTPDLRVHAQPASGRLELLGLEARGGEGCREAVDEALLAADAGVIGEEMKLGQPHPRVEPKLPQPRDQLRGSESRHCPPVSGRDDVQLVAVPERLERAAAPVINVRPTDLGPPVLGRPGEQRGDERLVGAVRRAIGGKERQEHGLRGSWWPR